MTQAGGTLAGSAAQSGLSKQRDFTVTQEILRGYGDCVKDTMKRVLRAIEAAREDGLVIDVAGLDEFDIGDFSGELKKLALKYLCDARQETKDQIVTEIDDWCEQN